MMMAGYKYIILIVLAGVFLLMSKETRGIRNNNPGNIRGSSDNWHGASGFDDANFVRFSDAKFGIRAMTKIIKNYQKIYLLVTIRQIINRWAPPTENDTESYINSVSARSGIDANRFVEEEDFPALIEAMIFHENGKQPYAISTIKSGIELA